MTAEPVIRKKQQSENQTDQCGNHAGHQTDQKRGSDGGNQFLEHVAAEVVGAERKSDDASYLVDGNVVHGINILDFNALIFARNFKRTFLSGGIQVRVEPFAGNGTFPT